MTNIPVEGMKFIPTSASLKRSWGDWTSDVVNVLDYGADPTGATDSTTAIQRALDAAFGDSTHYHSTAGAYLNKRVFFPPGDYKVSAPHPVQNVTNITHDGAGGTHDGHITFTTATAHGYTVGELVFIMIPYDPPDGGNDGTWMGLRRIASVPTTTTMTTTVIRNLNSFAAGTVTAHSVALRVTGVFGGLIEGSGPEVTRITNTTAGGICFTTNGFTESAIRGITFDSNNVGLSGCNIDMDGGVSAYPEGLGIQGVTVDTLWNCHFNNGRFGCMVGPTNGSQADTIPFFNCSFANNTEVDLLNGVFTNYNAISQSFFSCKFTSSGWSHYTRWATIGVWVGCTSKGVFASGSSNTPFIGGNTVTAGFFFYQTNASLIATRQVRPSNGTLLFTESANNVLGCYSNKGEIQGMHPGTSVRDTWFDRADAFNTNNAPFYPTYVKNCMVGGSPFNGAFSEPNYIDGMFMHFGSTQYFLGEKRVPTGATNSKMNVGDLPPAAANFTSGISVTVHDCTLAQTAANKNTIIDDGSHGGGSNKVRVLNDGTNWVMV